MSGAIGAFTADAAGVSLASWVRARKCVDRLLMLCTIVVYAYIGLRSHALTSALYSKREFSFPWLHASSLTGVFTVLYKREREREKSLHLGGGGCLPFAYVLGIWPDDAGGVCLSH